MRITRQLTDHAVQAEIGSRLARLRLERNITQEQLALDAGVTRRVVANLEAGATVRTTSLIRVLRVLDLLDRLDTAVPEPQPSPLKLLELQGRQRRRARGRGDQQSPPAPGSWKWGDES
jgi:transcriptional regulator with XRE-family HTH domain